MDKLFDIGKILAYILVGTGFVFSVTRGIFINKPWYDTYFDVIVQFLVSLTILIFGIGITALVKYFIQRWKRT